MIRINVVITVKPENRERLLRLLGEMGDLSRRENGCAGYEVLENVRSRAELMIVETWTDDEVLAAHKAADHFRRIIPEAKALAEDWQSLRFDF